MVLMLEGPVAKADKDRGEDDERGVAIKNDWMLDTELTGIGKVGMGFSDTEPGPSFARSNDYFLC